MLIATRLLTLALLAPTQGGAPTLESLVVDIWPEYDRPAALVLYQFRVSPTTSLDAPVPIPIPASVGEPHAVAWRDVQGKLLLADYVRRVEGERAMILARLGSYEGQLEFYMDIAFDGNERSFSFRWPGGVAIGSLSFDIQQPSGASGLEVVPEPTRRSSGSDGLDYAHVELGELDDAASPTVDVRYEKDSDRLTERGSPSSAPSAATASDAAEPSSGSGNAALYAVAGILFGAGAAWLGWSFWSTSTSSGSKRPTTAAPPQAPEEDGRSDEGTVGAAASYCHECGTKALPSATFCMECGTKLMKRPD